MPNWGFYGANTPADWLWPSMAYASFTKSSLTAFWSDTSIASSSSRMCRLLLSTVIPLYRRSVFTWRKFCGGIGDESRENDRYGRRLLMAVNTVDEGPRRWWRGDDAVTMATIAISSSTLVATRVHDDRMLSAKSRTSGQMSCHSELCVLRWRIQLFTHSEIKENRSSTWKWLTCRRWDVTGPINTSQRFSNT